MTGDSDSLTTGDPRCPTCQAIRPVRANFCSVPTVSPFRRLRRPRVKLELSPLVDPSVSLVEQMTDGHLEGIVLKDRTSTYRDGTRVGWSKVKDRSWYEREAWRFDRRWPTLRS